VPEDEKPFSPTEYRRMADELEIMSNSIRARPEMDHHFAERLALLAAEMREDLFRSRPEAVGSTCAISHELKQPQLI
jgi:hypothetical protein